MKIGICRSFMDRLRRERAIVGLIELLASIPIMVVILGSVMSLNLLTLNDSDRVESRARATIDEQILFERITRDLRHATQVTEFEVGDPDKPWDKAFVAFKARFKPPGGAVEEREIRWKCGFTACTREERSLPGGAWPSEPEQMAEFDPTKQRTGLELEMDPSFDPGCSDSTCNKPRTVTVEISRAVLNETAGENASRIGNPKNLIVLENTVELRNTRPQPDNPNDETDDCDFEPDASNPPCI